MTKGQSLGIILLLLISSYLIKAQTDWVRWEAKQVSYEIQSVQHHNYIVNKSGVGVKLLSYVRNAYYFLISDLDGDNCPFYPSCSFFFVQSVEETNLFKGILMFADRFTRDISFFKGKYHYPLHSSGKLFDPVLNYSLDILKIHYLPGGAFVN